MTVRLRDVQKLLKRTLPVGAILVGHSLENDLASLELRYDRVFDTQQHYPHPSPGYRSALANLVEKHLHVSMDRSSGHDSVVDAQMTMRLALLKLGRGWTYGQPRVDKVPFSSLLPLTVVDSKRPQGRQTASLGESVWPAASDDGEVGEASRSEASSSGVVTVAVFRGFELEGKARLGEMDAAVRRVVCSLPENSFVAIVVPGRSRSSIENKDEREAQLQKHKVEDAGGILFTVGKPYESKET